MGADLHRVSEGPFHYHQDARVPQRKLQNITTTGAYRVLVLADGAKTPPALKVGRDRIEALIRKFGVRGSNNRQLALTRFAVGPF